MYHNNASTDIAKSDEVVAPPQAEVKTITKIVYVDRTPKAVQHQTVTQTTPVQTQPVNNVPDVNTTGTSNTNTTTQTNTGETSAGTATGNTNNDINTSPTTTPVQKKGWSNAAKGATIGGVGGAVTGAILSKKKKKGVFFLCFTRRCRRLYFW